MENMISKIASDNAMHLLDCASALEETKRAYKIECDIDFAASDLATSLKSLQTEINDLQEFLKGERSLTNTGINHYADNVKTAVTKLMILMPQRKHHNHLLQD